MRPTIAFPFITAIPFAFCNMRLTRKMQVFCAGRASAWTAAAVAGAGVLLPHPSHSANASHFSIHFTLQTRNICQVACAAAELRVM